MASFYSKTRHENIKPYNEIVLYKIKAIFKDYIFIDNEGQKSDMEHSIDFYLKKGKISKAASLKINKTGNNFLRIRYMTPLNRKLEYFKMKEAIETGEAYPDFHVFGNFTNDALNNIFIIKTKSIYKYINYKGINSLIVHGGDNNSYVNIDLNDIMKYIDPDYYRIYTY